MSTFRHGPGLILPLVTSPHGDSNGFVIRAPVLGIRLPDDDMLGEQGVRQASLDVLTLLRGPPSAVAFEEFGGRVSLRDSLVTLMVMPLILQRVMWKTCRGSCGKGGPDPSGNLA